jgi:hypothetical protein
VVTVVPLRRPLQLAALRCADCGQRRVRVVGLPREETAPLVCYCLGCAVDHQPFQAPVWKRGSAKSAAR